MRIFADTPTRLFGAIILAYSGEYLFIPRGIILLNGSRQNITQLIS